MGLDMQLEKQTYVKNWNHKTDKHQVTIKLNNKIRKDINPSRISAIIEDVMYWRKANHIHSWFVSNVQDGVDDCGRYFVSIEKLKELAAQCDEVLKFDPSISPSELLPTQEGFFFGGTKYDEYYYDQCKETSKVIKSLLKEDHNEYGGDYYYSSSW